MNNSGDAAEQIVRLSLEGLDYTLRLAGSGAKHIATLLVAAFKSPDTANENPLKPSGKERLKTMLKSGQPLKIFGVKNKDLEQFAKEAKRYGVVYCALRDKNAKPDDLVDLMVRAEDAPKLDRILERLEFMSVEQATVETETDGKELDAPDVGDSENLMDMLIDEDGKPIPDSPEAQKAKEAAQKETPERNVPNPSGATMESGSPSEPSSKDVSPSEKVKSDKKPSVKEFLRERIMRNQKQREEQSKPEKTETAREDRRKQPQKQNQQTPQNQGGRKKSKKPKERD